MRYYTTTCDAIFKLLRQAKITFPRDKEVFVLAWNNIIMYGGLGGEAPTVCAPKGVFFVVWKLHCNPFCLGFYAAL